MAEMRWGRIDYGLRTHPRVAKLRSPTALSLYIMGILYAGQHLTDGAIDKDVVPGLLPPNIDRKGMGSAVNQLVRAGLWDRTPDGYAIHDYLDYQPSRASIEAARKKAQEAGRKGGEAAAAKRAAAA